MSEENMEKKPTPTALAADKPKAAAETTVKADAVPVKKAAPKKVVKKAPKKEPRKFLLSSSPHIRHDESVSKIMMTVTATLIPATIASTYIFGMRALILVLLGMAAAVATEWAIIKVFKMPGTLADGSALLTGLLVAFNIPAGTPFWIPVIGSFFAIAVAKMPFGGLGYNPLNPALVGRAFLLASWPLHMTKDWLPAFWWKKVEGFNFFSLKVDPASIMIDGASYATPLETTKSALKIVNNPEGMPTEIVTAANEKLVLMGDRLLDLMIGRVGGCIGETSAVFLLIGAAFLFYKGYIGWRVPFSFIAVVAVGGWMFGGATGFFSGDPLFHIFAGGLILGAFYMATDMVTSPITKKGRLYFGIGCGLLTLMIRMIGGYPEGVSYAILLMNLTVPLIDRWTLPRRFGHTNGKGGK